MLDCAICQGRLKSPKTLACFHSFCQACLQTLYENAGRNPRCPQCREEILIPLNTLTCSPFIEAQINVPNFDELINKRCEVCEESVATGCCYECNQYFCEGCQMAHKKLKISANHRFISIEESLQNTPETRKSYCPMHHLPIDSYCQTCSEAACSKCIVAKHGSHKALDLLAASGQIKQIIAGYLPSVKEQEKQVSKAVGQVGKKLDSLSTNLEKTKKSLEKGFEQIREELDHRYSQLYAEMEQYYHIKKKELELQQDELYWAQNSLKDTRTFAENLLQNGSQSEIAETKKSLESRLKNLTQNSHHLEPAHNPTLEFHEKDKWDPLATAISEYGSIGGRVIMISYEHSFIQRIKANQSIKAKVGRPFIFNIIAHDLKDQRIRSGGGHFFVNVKGPAQAKEVKIVDKNNGTYSVSVSAHHSGKYVISVSLRQVEIKNSPFQLIVGDQASFEINLLKKPNIVIGQGDLSSCSAICLNSKGEILALDQGNLLKVFDQDGLLIPQRQFGGFQKVTIASLLARNTGFQANLSVAREISQMITDHNDNIYILDQNNRQIQVLDSQGKLILAITNNQLQAPSSFAVNRRNGNIFVLEKAYSRMHIFDSEGKLVKTVNSVCDNQTGIYSLQSPNAIGINSKGEIFVLTSQYYIYILDQDGKILRSHANIGHANSLYIDEDDNLYLCSGQAINIFNLAMKAIHTVNLENSSGFTLNNINNQIGNCCFDSSLTRLYINGRSHILVIEPSEFEMSSLGSQPSAKIGDKLLSKPSAVCVNSKSEILVADHATHKIHMFDQNGKLTRSIVSGNRVQLNSPCYLAVDLEDQIYVGEQSTNSIHLFTPSGNYLRTIGVGIISKLTGIAVNGAGNLHASDLAKKSIHVFTSKGTLVKDITGTLQQGNLSTPMGIAINSKENFFVPNNQSIELYDPEGSFIQHLQKSQNHYDLYGYIQSPNHIYADRQDRIYIFNDHQIMIINQAGYLVHEIPMKLNNQPQGHARHQQQKTENLVGVCFDSILRRIYVANGSELQVFGEMKLDISFFGNSPPKTIGKDQLVGCHQVRFDSQKQLIALDRFTKAIQIFDKAGGFIRTIEEVVLNQKRQKIQPIDVAVDRNGNIYVLDQAKIFVFKSNWQLSYALGESRLKKPEGLAYDPRNNALLVTDSQAQEILVIKIQDNTIRRIQSQDADQSDPDFPLLNHPTKIAVNSKGDIFVCDRALAPDMQEMVLEMQEDDIPEAFYTNKIEVFDAELNFLKFFGNSDGFGSIEGFFIDQSNDNVYVMDGGRNSLHIFDKDDKEIHTINFVDSKSKITPFGICLDPSSERLYLANQTDIQVIAK